MRGRGCGADALNSAGGGRGNDAEGWGRRGERRGEVADHGQGRRIGAPEVGDDLRVGPACQ
jgi:hypothetical protein